MTMIGITIVDLMDEANCSWIEKIYYCRMSLRQKILAWAFLPLFLSLGLVVGTVAMSWGCGLTIITSIFKGHAAGKKHFEMLFKKDHPASDFFSLKFLK